VEIIFISYTIKKEEEEINLKDIKNNRIHIRVK